MKRPKAEELQTIVAQGHIDHAVAILERLDPKVAADTFLSLPYDDQKDLFGRLPIEFSARLAPIFPYYHTFVLLHALPRAHMTAVIEDEWMQVTETPCRQLHGWILPPLVICAVGAHC